MTGRSIGLLLLGLLIVVTLTGYEVFSDGGLPVHQLATPEGFRIEVFADGVDNARQMALTPNGTLFVGTRQAGRVYAVLDEDHDQAADRVVTVATGLDVPNGVAFKDGDLYVAEISRILRFDQIESRLSEPPAPVVVYDELPTEAYHGWRYLAFGPDGKLYTAIGSPCNVCDSSEEDPRFATIVRMNADGTDLEIVAHGVRNSLGFDWHPETGDLWFTNNGRDRLGDEQPADTLNHAPRVGLHFGFPFCHAGDVQDPEYSARRCDTFAAPAQKLGPHVAALGMRFYTGSMFPEQYANAVFIAEHGSWNRTPESGHTGYQISVVRPGNTRTTYEPFVEGWLDRSNTSWGRPVDVLQMPDGALLVSDDKAGAIYRVSYTEAS